MVKKTESYYLDMPDDLLDYVERDALAMLKRLEQSFFAMRERCYKLATLLCTGSAGSAMFFMTKDCQYRLQLAILSLAWLGCLFALFWFCIRSTTNPSAYAPPDELYMKGDTLAYVRRARLCGYSEAAQRLEKFNAKRGKAFNVIAIVCAAVPAVVLVWLMISGHGL